MKNYVWVELHKLTQGCRRVVDRNSPGSFFWLMAFPHRNIPLFFLSSFPGQRHATFPDTSAENTKKNVEMIKHLPRRTVWETSQLSAFFPARWWPSFEARRLKALVVSLLSPPFFSRGWRGGGRTKGPFQKVFPKFSFNNPAAISARARPPPLSSFPSSIQKVVEPITQVLILNLFPH